MHWQRVCPRMEVQAPGAPAPPSLHAEACRLPLLSQLKVPYCPCPQDSPLCCICCSVLQGTQDTCPSLLDPRTGSVGISLGSGEVLSKRWTRAEETRCWCQLGKGVRIGSSDEL